MGIKTVWIQERWNGSSDELFPILSILNKHRATNNRKKKDLHSHRFVFAGIPLLPQPIKNDIDSIIIKKTDFFFEN